LFLDALGEILERFSGEFFAYVLMDNPYHLFLKTKRVNLYSVKAGLSKRLAD